MESTIPGEGRSFIRHCADIENVKIIGRRGSRGCSQIPALPLPAIRALLLSLNRAARLFRVHCARGAARKPKRCRSVLPR